MSAIELEENELKEVNGGSSRTHLTVYIVRRGDSLDSIAAKFNTTAIILRQLNRIINDRIKIGQKLLIPIVK